MDVGMEKLSKDLWWQVEENLKRKAFELDINIKEAIPTFKKIY